MATQYAFKPFFLFFFQPVRTFKNHTNSEPEKTFESHSKMGELNGRLLRGAPLAKYFKQDLPG